MKVKPTATMKEALPELVIFFCQSKLFKENATISQLLSLLASSRHAADGTAYMWPTGTDLMNTQFCQIAKLLSL